MDGSLPRSSVHGIFQARVLEWVAISFSRRSSPPRDQTQASCIIGKLFTVWATREVLELFYIFIMHLYDVHCKGRWQSYTDKIYADLINIE